MEELTVFPDAFLNSSVGIGKGALPVPFAILEFTDVFVPIGKGYGEVSVWQTILVFTNVFGPIGKGHGALSVW